MNHNDDKKDMQEESGLAQSQELEESGQEVAPVESGAEDAVEVPLDVETPVDVAEQRPPAARGFWLPLVIASLFLLLIMAAAGYYLWQQGRLQQMELRQTLQEASTAQQSQWQKRDEEKERQLDELSSQQRELQASISKVHELASRNSQDWAVAEVEYLLLIANHRLQLQQDIKTSIAALQLADERLRDMASPTLMKVRGEIATEIEALRTLGLPDYNGMALQLDALSQQVEQLQTRAAHPVIKEAHGSEESQHKDGGDGAPDALDWRALPEGVWNELKTLVVIRRHDQKILPMLTPQQEQLLRQGLRLKLEASRIHLLQRDEQGFRQELLAAMEWLENYFDPEQKTATDMKKSLEALRQEKLQISVPDISASLESLRAEKQ